MPKKKKVTNAAGGTLYEMCKWCPQLRPNSNQTFAKTGEPCRYCAVKLQVGGK